MSKLKCEVCNEKESKYTCPRCKLKTCCLLCVKQHKQQANCNGVRDKTAHIAISKFTDTDLLSDYRFLEDTARKACNASRDRLRLKKDRPKLLNQLIREAKNRGTELKVLPFPMTRRKYNSTRYMYIDKVLYWKLDLLFPQSEAKYTEIRINENNTVEEILMKYTSTTDSDPVIRQKLKQYVVNGPDLYKIYLLADDRPMNDPKFYELESDKSLKDNLCGKIIVEYPVLHIVMKSHWTDYTLLTTEEITEIRDKIDSKPLENTRFNRRRQYFKHRQFNNRRHNSVETD